MPTNLQNIATKHALEAIMDSMEIGPAQRLVLHLLIKHIMIKLIKNVLTIVLPITLHISALSLPAIKNASPVIS